VLVVVQQSILTKVIRLDCNRKDQVELMLEEESNNLKNREVLQQDSLNKDL
jgi:hypothetical protein